jgi:hypothetical protein
MNQTQTTRFFALFFLLLILSPMMALNLVSAVESPSVNQDTYDLGRNLKINVSKKLVQAPNGGYVFEDGRFDYYRVELSSPSIVSFEDRGIFQQLNDTTTYYASVRAKLDYNYYSVISINQLSPKTSTKTAHMLTITSYVDSWKDTNLGTSILKHSYADTTLSLSQLYTGAGFKISMEYTPFQTTVSALGSAPATMNVRFDKIVFGGWSEQDIGKYDDSFQTDYKESTLTSSTIPSSGSGYAAAEGGKASLQQTFTGVTWRSAGSVNEYTLQQKLLNAPSSGSQITMNTENKTTVNIPITLQPQITQFKQVLTLKDCAEVKLDTQTQSVLGVKYNYAGVDYVAPIVSSQVTRCVGGHVHNKYIRGSFNVDMTVFSKVKINLQEFLAESLEAPEVKAGDVVWDAELKGDSAETITIPTIDAIPDQIRQIIYIILIVAAIIGGIYVYIQVKPFLKAKKSLE